MATRLVKDSACIERLLARLIRLHHLLSDYPSYQDLVCKADMKLLEFVIFDFHHCLLPIILPVLPRRPGLHTLTFQLKTPRILYPESCIAPLFPKATL